MPAGDEFVEYCLDLLSALGPTKARRMFGGYGLYVGERFVAIIADQRLYLKTDDASRPAFVAARCQPFEYDAAGGRRQVTSYWSAPDDALESPASMQPWARRALDAAQRAAARPTTRARRRTSAAARKR